VAEEPELAPPGVDAGQANPARVYDYWLGGRHNFPADRELGAAISALDPVVPAGARANRAFLGRAVRFLAGAGITQFLDVGSGLPAAGNVHEIARRADPAARVAYVDADPAVTAHSQAILGDDRHAAAIRSDLREPGRILADPAVRRLIDFSRPAGLLLVAVLHFVPDADDPWRAVAALRDALAPGSYVVLGQGTNADKPAVAGDFEETYSQRASSGIRMRSRADIRRFFDGLELVEPGLVYVSQWRPDSPADVPADPSQFANLVGVARKP
jgi:SAM-dependent methyltransferase